MALSAATLPCLFAEKAGKRGFRAAQNEIVQRRSVRDDDAHRPTRILSSVALSASKSAAE